ncbi:MAG: hypothetical protein PUH94_05295 [Firmicutes bacterium]|nr:hypothetical protein [Bacillota bacterium]
MIKTIEMLRNEFTNFKNPDAKVKRMVDDGKLVPVVRGLYETDASVPGHYLAASIYGPSYLSFEFALGYHSLIPESVYNFTCATLEKKKRKRYVTPFGVFTYRDVPSKAYPAEIILVFENNYSFQIATAEKALCDMLYKVSPLKNLRGIGEYIFEDLRIDEKDFLRLDMNKLLEISQLYNTQNHRLLDSMIRKIRGKNEQIYPHKSR